MTTSTLEKNVLKQCDDVFDEVIEFTQSMVSQYAVLNQEQGVLNVVEQRLQDLNLAPTRVSLDAPDLRHHALFAPVSWDHENKYNLVTALNPKAEGKSLVFNGHLDVVPAEPHDMWLKPPHESYLNSGQLFGRGSGDMQSGVAAMIYAVHAVQRAGIDILSPLTIQAVIEEECSGNGALACVHAGHGGDFVLIPEPFGPQILAGQIGVIWFTLSVYGKPAHVLDTSAGIDALEQIQKVTLALKQLEERLNNEFNVVAPYTTMDHPYNLNVGKLSGGNWASSVAAFAKAEARIGFPPMMSSQTIMQLIQDTIAPLQQQMLANNQGKLLLRFEGFRSEGHLVDLEHSGIGLLSHCHFDLLQQQAQWYYATCTTDLRAFHCYDRSAGTCYGPIARNIHGVDECVDVESIKHVLKTYALFIMRWCETQAR